MQIYNQKRLGSCKYILQFDIGLFSVIQLIQSLEFCCGLQMKCSDGNDPYLQWIRPNSSDGLDLAGDFDQDQKRKKNVANLFAIKLNQLGLPQRTIKGFGPVRVRNRKLVSLEVLYSKLMSQDLALEKIRSDYISHYERILIMCNTDWYEERALPEQFKRCIIEYKKDVYGRNCFEKMYKTDVFGRNCFEKEFEQRLMYSPQKGSLKVAYGSLKAYKQKELTDETKLENMRRNLMRINDSGEIMEDGLDADDIYIQADHRTYFYLSPKVNVKPVVVKHIIEYGRMVDAFENELSRLRDAGELLSLNGILTVDPSKWKNEVVGCLTVEEVARLKKLKNLRNRISRSVSRVSYLKRYEESHKVNLYLITKLTARDIQNISQQVEIPKDLFGLNIEANRQSLKQYYLSQLKRHSEQERALLEKLWLLDLLQNKQPASKQFEVLQKCKMQGMKW